MTAEHAPNIHPGDGPGPGHGEGPGYETRDASVPALLTFGVGLIIFMAVLQLVMLGFYRLFVSERPDPIKVAATENLYQQLRELRDAEKAALGSYGWVDRKAGVVRIPIDRAIELVAEKGDRFSKGPKTELEMYSHAGTPVPAGDQDKDKDKDKGKTPPEGTGTKK